jgi:serine protease DegQ
MAKRLWLIFSQVATVMLAIIFVISTLKPSLLSGFKFFSPISSVTLKESTSESGVIAPGSYHEAVKKSMPAVVNVFSSKNIDLASNSSNSKKSKSHPKPPNSQEEWFNFFFGDPNNQPNNQQDDAPEFSTGSGVIISQEGLIMTNHHVIEGADVIEVALGDGRKTKATLVGSDPDTDIAILKIDLKDLPEPIVFADINSVHVGDVVLAIGNPFGVGQTVTSGIVSALGRDHLGINTFENFIQTDAAINPGNSGGALVDTQGRLIGINTAIFSKNGGSMGIGFAIPVNLAKQVMESIVQKGSVTRGWIGVQSRELSPDEWQAFKLPENSKGVLISGVLKNGPAEKSGIKAGDVVRQINDKSITDLRDLLNTVAGLEPGTKANINVNRNGQTYNFVVVIGTRPSASETKR